jgi:hypothetical protein
MAERATGAPAGTWPLLAGAIVRTIGGAATADGDATGEGDGAATGDGLALVSPGEGVDNARNA